MYNWSAHGLAMGGRSGVAWSAQPFGFKPRPFDCFALLHGVELPLSCLAGLRRPSSSMTLDHWPGMFVIDL